MPGALIVISFPALATGGLFTEATIHSSVVLSSPDLPLLYLLNGCRLNDN